MPLGPSAFWRIVVGCTLAGLVAGWLMANQRHGRASARQVRSMDSLTQAVQQADTVYLTRRVTDRTTSLRVAELERRADSLHRLQGRLGALAASQAESLRVTLDSTQTVALDSLRGLQARQVGVLRLEIGVQDSIILAQNSRIAWRDSTIGELRGQLAEAMRQLRAAVEAGRPKRTPLAVRLVVLGLATKGALDLARAGP